MTPTERQTIQKALKRLSGAEVELQQAKHDLEALLGTASGPVLTPAEAKRVGLYGRWAAAHAGSGGLLGWRDDSR